MDASMWANSLTGVLVVVTAIYVYLTWRIANANQRMLERVEEQHREEMRPNVFASLEFRAQTVARLVVENKGKTPAYRLRASIDKDFYQFASAGSTNVREIPFFTEETPWFPPGARVVFDLAQGFNFDVVRGGANITPSNFLVKLEYESKFDSYEDECKIDVRPYLQMHVEATIGEQIGRIENTLKKIASKL